MSGMAPPQSPPRKTLEDYLALPDPVRAELIEGELYVTPSPTSRHQEASDNLLVRLGTFVRRTGQGRMYSAPLDVHLPSGDVVQPDLIYVSHERGGIVRDWVHGVPDHLIEVVSPGNPERDRIVKRALYAKNGVPAYWIVDPKERSIELLHLEGEAFAPAGFLAGEGVLRAPTFEGLEIDLAAIFPAG